ncbi:GNAT family N-acetyltransferase [Rheinheimera soli]|uniref:GNAT family N-acetyltransferase n=1 Tax=Rheinheimera soli TaxID=443616 RepID=UPI001E4C958D|nr:GNAT family N-acetyltransferase [Rheinheimera soli]
MDIRQATEADVEAIVSTHIVAFQGFFLTMLGPVFLKKMYSAFINQPNGLMRVAVDPERGIVGFAAGSVAPEVFFSVLRKKQWHGFLLAALPSILKNPAKVVKKLYYALFYKGDKPKTLKKNALLSSIAVCPDMSGKSIGKALLRDFELQVRQAGLDGLYLTTDKFGNDNVVAFYQKAGYQIENEFTQPDRRQMLRLVKSI